MKNLLRGRDNGPKHPDLSLHSYHYAPQNHAIFNSSPPPSRYDHPKSDRLLEYRAALKDEPELHSQFLVFPRVPRYV